MGREQQEIEKQQRLLAINVNGIDSLSALQDLKKVRGEKNVYRTMADDCTTRLGDYPVTFLSSDSIDSGPDSDQTSGLGPGLPAPPASLFNDSLPKSKSWRTPSSQMREALLPPPPPFSREAYSSLSLKTPELLHNFSKMGLPSGPSTAELQVLLGSNYPNQGIVDSGDEEAVPSSPFIKRVSTAVHSFFPKWHPSDFIGLFSALLYGIVGLAMGFINKAVLQLWPFSNSFLLFQMGSSLFLLYLLSALGLLSLPPVDLKSARALSGVVFFYNANVAFALAAVQALSIPVYHVLKRLTPVFILLIKVSLGGAFPPPELLGAVSTIVAGCFFAGAGDLGFDMMGYVFAVISCLLQSAYLIQVERSGSEKGYSSNELLVYNALLSLPVLMLLTLATGEIQLSLLALVDLTHSSPHFLAIFIASLLMGVLLNYSLFLCTQTNSALATSIVGALRSVLGTVLGFFLLGGVKATVFIIVGTAMNTAGGVWYTALKFRSKSIDR